MAEIFNNVPSMNPADNNSLAGSIRFSFSKLIQKINGMLPAQVINYDLSTNRVQVQLMISLITTGGDYIARPQINNLPVYQLGGGGFFISFPIKTGDLGWLIANDRDISNFLQTYSQSIPNTYRISQFSDGVFFPDIMRGYTRAPGADEGITIQNESGSVSLTLSDDGVNINSTGQIRMTTPNLGVIGNITATGSISPGTPPPP
jgi:hypothetical protein